jgi:glycosyltransferase involved in cell wall biosynthesis
VAAWPVYYQAPLYRRLASDPRIDFTAIFASSAGATRPSSAGYGTNIQWDADALAGYRSVFLARAQRNQPSGFFSLRDLDIMIQVLRERFDVLWIHGYNYLTLQLALITQRLSRKPVLLREEQTLLHPRPKWKELIKDVVLRRELSKAHALYIGTQNHRWFEHYGVTADRAFFAPYCVDDQALRSAAQALPPKREVRRYFAVPDSAGPLIVMVGRLIPKKQPGFLLEAFSRVRAQRHCALLFVGSGVLETSLRAQARRRNIPNVYFAGFLNQSSVARAYHAADIFVLPSKMHETWGLATNEAMNFRLPVIVTDKVGCAVDLVQDGRNGFVVSSDDPAQLAVRLAALVDSPGLRREFGSASYGMITDWNYEVSWAGVIAATQRAMQSG